MVEVEAPKKASRKSSAFLYVAAGSALLGAVAMGTVLGWSSPAILSMKEITINSSLESDMKQNEDWISGSLTLGGLVGALASGPLAQIFGRKITLIISGVPMILGYGCLCLAPNMALIIIGRVLTGFSAGLVSGTVPSYVVEISTENVRGMLGIGFQFCVTIGILFVYAFGSLMSWKLLSMICILFPVAMLVLMLFMPETPIWLMTKSGGDFSKGSAIEKALRKLRDESNDNESELKEMSESTAQTQNSKGFSLKDIKNPLFYKPLIISIFLMFFQQFLGINPVIYMYSDFGSMIVLEQLFVTFVCALLVDRLGRKILLIGSGATLIASYGLLIIYHIENIAKFPLLWINVNIFIKSFSFGWGPIPWLMIAEITPIEFRSVVMAVATGVNLLCLFIINSYINWFQTFHKYPSPHQTPQVIFLSVSIILCVLSILFVLKCLPETKNKPFVEIIRHFTKDVPKYQYITKDETNLKKHQLIHKNVKQFECNECHKQFRQSNGLLNDKQIHLNVKTFKCNECNKKFNRKYNLISHRLVHTNQRKFVCDWSECGKQFYSKSLLIEHKLYIHSNETKFKCDYNNCEKKFFSKSHLEIHKRIHSGEKPFNCVQKYCDKKFNSKPDINSDKRLIDLKERKFKYDYENYDKSRSHLEKHKLTDSGERPFTCDYKKCDQRFTTKTNLIQHKKRVHNYD